MRAIQVRPGTQSIYTDQADYVGEIRGQDYLNEIVRRFNGFAAQEEQLQDLKDELAEIKRDRDGQKDRIQDLEQEVEDLQGEINDREVDDEI